jgi:hypothetical protein
VHALCRPAGNAAGLLKGKHLLAGVDVVKLDVVAAPTSPVVAGQPPALQECRLSLTGSHDQYVGKYEPSYCSMLFTEIGQAYQHWSEGHVQI